MMEDNRSEQYEELLTLQFSTFNYMVRFDRQLCYSLERAELEWRLHLWFASNDRDAGSFYVLDKQQLHCIFLGVDMSPLPCLPGGVIYLKIASIKDRQWRDLNYEVRDYEGEVHFYCRDYALQLEEVDPISS